jgi:antitoxin FitA
MTILLELDEVQSQRLRDLALALKVDANELARAAINDLVSRPADDFDRAVHYVLEKNRELYRRLA